MNKRSKEIEPVWRNATTFGDDIILSLKNQVIIKIVKCRLDSVYHQPTFCGHSTNCQLLFGIRSL